MAEKKKKNKTGNKRFSKDVLNKCAKLIRIFQSSTFSQI